MCGVVNNCESTMHARLRCNYRRSTRPFHHRDTDCLNCDEHCPIIHSSTHTTVRALCVVCRVSLELTFASSAICSSTASAATRRVCSSIALCDATGKWVGQLKSAHSRYELSRPHTIRTCWSNAHLDFRILRAGFQCLCLQGHVATVSHTFCVCKSR